MRITLTLLTVVGLLLSACKKDSNILQPNQVAMQKEIEFKISSKQDYSTTAMKDVNVTVKLSILKVSVNDRTETVLWDSTFSNFTMGQLSLPENQISIKKPFPGIEDNETLTARYSLILGEPLRAGTGSLQAIENGATSVIVPVKL